MKFQFTGEDGNYLYIDNVRLGLEGVVLEDVLPPNKFLIKRIDLLGRETINNNFYIDIFNDGTVKKHYKL